MDFHQTAFLKSDKVWFTDQEEKFALGTILKNTNETPSDGYNATWSSRTFSVITESGDILQKRSSELLPADSEFGFRDNCSLKFLNTPNVLENITVRFKQALHGDSYGIYTFTGSILLVVNPYCNIPSLYDEKTLLSYIGKSISAVNPHPFAIAEAAYAAMLKNGASQSIVISGESGSGKTECSKHVLKYLAYNSGYRQNKQQSTVLEERVIQTNPILEAFGNATTVRNVNSSRFGKLIQLYFNSNGQMKKSSLSTYLLAKSRVCEVPSEERNYHIFYWLCDDVSEDLRQELLLHPSSQYKFLNSQCTASVPSKLQEVRQAMDALNSQKTFHQKDVFKTLSIILTLGNLEFVEGYRHGDHMNNVTVIDWQKSSISNTGNGQAVMKPVTDLEILHTLMGLDTAESQQQFELALTSKKICDTRSNLPVAQAKQTLNALARNIYQKLFDFLVEKINEILQFPESESPLDGSDKATLNEEILQSVGVLDIFGFEDMVPYSNNGFEQLCINYANERLHNFFLQQLITKDAEIYAKEGIEPPEVSMLSSLTSSACCLSIFNNSGHGPPGIFQLLDEVSLAPVVGAKDNFFCQKVNKTLGQSERTQGDPPLSGVFLSKKKFTLSKDFTVRHFSGDVTYVAEGFYRQNVDFLSKELQECMESCSNNFLSSVLFGPRHFDTTPRTFKMESSGHKQFETIQSETQLTPRRIPQQTYHDAEKTDRFSRSKHKTLSSLFCSQVVCFIELLEKTSSWFIRCIKPNNHQQFTLPDQKIVRQQLETGGMIHALQWLAKGYPCRLLYDDLWKRYGELLPEFIKASVSKRDFAKLVFLALGTLTRDFQLGYSSVFFRFGVLQQVDALRQMTDPVQKNTLMKRISHVWHKCRVRRCFLVAVCTIHLSFIIRHKRFFQLAKEAQEYYRTIYQQRYRSAQLIQSSWRRRQLKKQHTQIALAKISNWCLTWIYRYRFVKIRTQILSLQCIVKASIEKLLYHSMIYSVWSLQMVAFTKLGRHIFLTFVDNLRQERAARFLQRWWKKTRLTLTSRTSHPLLCHHNQQQHQRFTSKSPLHDRKTVSDALQCSPPFTDTPSQVSCPRIHSGIRGQSSLRPPLPLLKLPTPQDLPPRNSLSQCRPFASLSDEQEDSKSELKNIQNDTPYSSYERPPAKRLSNLSVLSPVTPKFITPTKEYSLSHSPQSKRKTCHTGTRFSENPYNQNLTFSASRSPKHSLLVKSISRDTTESAFQKLKHTPVSHERDISVLRSIKGSPLSHEAYNEDTVSTKKRPTDDLSFVSPHHSTRRTSHQDTPSSTFHYTSTAPKFSPCSLLNNLKETHGAQVSLPKKGRLSISRDVASLIRMPEFHDAVLQVLKQQLLPLKSSSLNSPTVSDESEHSFQQSDATQYSVKYDNYQSEETLLHRSNTPSKNIIQPKRPKLTVQRQTYIETTAIKQQPKSGSSLAYRENSRSTSPSSCTVRCPAQERKNLISTFSPRVHQSATKSKNSTAENFFKKSSLTPEVDLKCESRRVSWLVMEDHGIEKCTITQEKREIDKETLSNKQSPRNSLLLPGLSVGPEYDAASPLLSYYPKEASNAAKNAESSSNSFLRRSIFITDDVLLAKRTSKLPRDMNSPRQRARILARYTTSRIPRLKRKKNVFNDRFSSQSNIQDTEILSSAQSSSALSVTTGHPLSSVVYPSSKKNPHINDIDTKSDAVEKDTAALKLPQVTMESDTSALLNTVPSLSTIPPRPTTRTMPRPYPSSFSKLPRLI